MKSMVLVAERKLADFISPPTHDGVLEASGVIVKGADYYVIFDNVRRIARIHRSLEPGSERHSWFGRKREGAGYEDIAFSRYTRRFYLLKYQTLEGLCWLTDRSFVCVSDLSKRGYKKACRKTDQSIHLFKLPRGHATYDRRAPRTT